MGFAKGYDENMAVLQPRSLRRLRALLGDRPLLVGASRKRFISKIISDAKAKRSSVLPAVKLSEAESLAERDLGTSGACCAALLGGADILRVHDVKTVRTVCDVFCGILQTE